MGEIHREFNHWLSLSCPANSLPLSTANHRRTSKSLGDTRPSQIKISRSDLNLWEMADGLYKEGWTDGNSNRMNNSETDLILEKLLVARAQERDESAFRELVMRYERRMLYYLHRLLGNHADLAKRWRHARTRSRNLMRLGVSRRQAIRHAKSRKASELLT